MGAPPAPSHKQRIALRTRANTAAITRTTELHMKTAPLSDAELDFVESILLKYGNDDSILDACELDGFFTALISGPEVLPPSRPAAGCRRCGAAQRPSSPRTPNCNGL